MSQATAKRVQAFLQDKLKTFDARAIGDTMAFAGDVHKNVLLVGYMPSEFDLQPVWVPIPLPVLMVAAAQILTATGGVVTPWVLPTKVDTCA